MRVLRQHIGIGVADISDAIGGQNHPIDRAIPIVPRREIVAQTQPGFRVGGIHRIQAGDGGQDVVAILDRSRLDDGPRPIGVRDDRDPVVGAKLIDQRGQAVLHHLHLVVFTHRAGHVDDEGEQCVLALPAGQVLALNADLDHVRALTTER